MDDIAHHIQELPRRRRRWALPILLVLLDSDAEQHGSMLQQSIRKRFDALWSQEAWSENRWERNILYTAAHLKELGILSGGRGSYVLTDAAREWCANRLPEVTSLDLPDASRNGAEGRQKSPVPMEMVTATDARGYQVPILRCLESGPKTVKQIHSDFPQYVRMIEGDRRISSLGLVLWQYRCGWALTSLKRQGEVTNPVRATWEITESGRDRLQREAGTWDISRFQDSRASVRLDGEAAAFEVDEEPADFEHLKPTISAHLYQTLRAVLRPGLASDSDERRRALIFYGPPGTGKTHLARGVAAALSGEAIGEETRTRIVQFHPSYAYEDFIQGLRPNVQHTQLSYHLVSGPFLLICEAAESCPDELHVLIIDEINRGDPARIFGELLYALEYRDEPVTLASGGMLKVPKNLIILGTMNSVDRSVALVDYALRRRFSFLRVEPHPGCFDALWEAGPDCTRAQRALRAINAWLSSTLDADHTIGHSYFLGEEAPSLEKLELIWQLDLAPLMAEYFFDQPEQLLEARSVWESALRG
jgi:5-methylcytosine-specific restriction protein B